MVVMAAKEGEVHFFVLRLTTVQIEMWYGNGGTERPRSPLGAIWNGVKNNGEKGAEVVRT